MDAAQNLDLLRAHGRCNGALIFTVFGGYWLLLFCVYSGRFHVPEVLLICALTGLLAVAGARVRRGQPAPVLDRELEQRKKRDDRAFGIVNAVTYTCVFLLFAVLPRFGLSNYVFPGFVAVIGLHFFPMPPLFRHTANLVTGSFMVLWAIFCALAFRENGNAMAAYVALGAGLALWSSAVSALLSASRLFAKSRENSQSVRSLASR